MKTLSFFTALLIISSVSAQSLQDSFNKALDRTEEKENSTVNQSADNQTFQANIDYSQKGVQLKWEVDATDKTNKFIIEKSADKYTWIQVSTVFGAAHKQQLMEYFIVDFMPLANLSYYRLIQVDKNGNELLSNIIPVNYVLTEYNTAGINLCPISIENHEFKITNIAWEEIFDKEILLVLRSKKGEEYYSKAVINIDNEKLIAVPIEIEIPSGEYLITASSENQIYSQNIIIN